MGRCNPITKTCTRTPWWRSAMGIDWIGSGGGGTPEPALYVSNAGAGTGDGSSEANAMSAAAFLAYAVLEGDDVRILEDLEV